MIPTLLQSKRRGSGADFTWPLGISSVSYFVKLFLANEMLGKKDQQVRPRPRQVVRDRRGRFERYGDGCAGSTTLDLGHELLSLNIFV